VFNPFAFTFERASPRELREHVHRNPRGILAAIEQSDAIVGREMRHYIFKMDRQDVIQARTDRDEGRFFICSLVNNKKILFYDPHNLSLYVPRWLGLPRLVAKSLAMVQGVIPIHYDPERPRGIPCLRRRDATDRWVCFNDRTNYTRYRGVPPKIVKILAKKLGNLKINSVNYT